MSILEMIQRDLREQGIPEKEIMDVLEQFIDLGNYAYL